MLGIVSNKVKICCLLVCPPSSITMSTLPIFLKKYIGKKIILVEIGVLNGGSLFMWRDFLMGMQRSLE